MMTGAIEVCYHVIGIWEHNAFGGSLFPKKFFAFFLSEKVFVIVHKNRVAFMVKTMVCDKKEKLFLLTVLTKNGSCDIMVITQIFLSLILY